MAVIPFGAMDGYEELDVFTGFIFYSLRGLMWGILIGYIHQIFFWKKTSKNKFFGFKALGLGIFSGLLLMGVAVLGTEFSFEGLLKKPAVVLDGLLQIQSGKPKERGERMYEAVQQGDIRKTNYLLTIGQSARTYFSTAAEKGNLPILKMLWEEGAKDGDVSANELSRALLLAVKKNHIEIAEYLIEHGADINYLDSDQQTPLQVAMSPEMTQMLLAKGAKANGEKQIFIPSKHVEGDYYPQNEKFLNIMKLSKVQDVYVDRKLNIISQDRHDVVNSRKDLWGKINKKMPADQARALLGVPADIVACTWYYKDGTVTVIDDKVFSANPYLAAKISKASDVTVLLEASEYFNSIE